MQLTIVHERLGVDMSFGLTLPWQPRSHDTQPLAVLRVCLVRGLFGGRLACVCVCVCVCVLVCNTLCHPYNEDGAQ